MLQQLVAVCVAWYQQSSVYLSTAGIKALMRLADTLAASAAATGSSSGGGAGAGSSWQLLIQPLHEAVVADVKVVLALAHRQLSEAAAAAEAARAAERRAAAGASSGGSAVAAAAGFNGAQAGSPPGSPGPRTQQQQQQQQQQQAGGGYAGHALSRLGPQAAAAAAAAGGGAAARQAAADAAAAAALTQHLRVRTRQLVLLQRAIAAIHRDCRRAMSWAEQQQLLQVLALGVEAALTFNTGISLKQQRQQQQRLHAAAAAAATAHCAQQQQQPRQQQLLQAVPEHALGSGRSGSDGAVEGSFTDSMSLMSAVSSSAAGSISSSGSAAGGAQPPALQPFGSAIRVTSCSVDASSSVGGSSSSGAGALAAAGRAGSSSVDGPAGGGDTSRRSSTDAFFQLRTPAGSTAGGAAADGLHLSSAGGASDAAAVAAAAASGDTALRQGHPEITPASPQPTQQQQQQQHGEPQPPAQQVRTSLFGPTPANGAAARGAAGAGSNSGSPGWAQGGAAAWPAGAGGSGDMPVLMVSSPEAVEVVLPALMRLEAEGGLLLIQVCGVCSCLRGVERRLIGAQLLQRAVITCCHPHRPTPCAQALQLCCSEPAAAGEAGSTAAEAVSALKQQLLQLVRCVIEIEAACSSMAAPGAGAGTSTAAAQDSSLQDALAGVGWQHAARAPLVVAALGVLSGLQGADEYQRQVLALFPALCRLMCSSHHLTRAAVAQVLASPHFLALLPAAAAVAAGLGAGAAPAAAAAAAAAGPAAAAATAAAGRGEWQQSWQQVPL
jgi:hypothetical protein